MADVPNMLEMPRPTIGDVANPSPFYTDAPPAGQDEFNSRYQEALGFLKSPEWKAAALQMAIAAIQPRVPGQSVLGHLANAVGQGAEAAGRVTLQEEGRQLRQSKEQREERELTVREKQVAQTGEYQKESLQLQRERQIQESKQFGLQIKKLEDAEERAKGEDRRKLLQNLGTLYQKALEKEQEALTLATDKEKPTIQKNIQGLQEKLGRVTAVLEKEISTIVPGAFPKAEEKPKAPVVDDVKFNEWLKINPAAVTALKKAGRLSTTPEQDKALADADPSFAAEQDKDRVVPRETKTFWGDVGRAAGSVLSGGTFTNTVELQLRTLDDPRTPENLKQMAKARILSALPSPDAKGEIPKLQLSEWELIFKDKRLSKIMLERLGEEKFNKAKKEFEDRAPRTNTKDARRQREMKAFD